MVYNAPKPADKIVPIVCGIVFLAFLVSVPFMVADQNKRKAELWQEHGCHMYDNYRIERVPAKCHAYFIDHYAPQPLREQPNVKGGE